MKPGPQERGHQRNETRTSMRSRLPWRAVPTWLWIALVAVPAALRLAISGSDWFPDWGLYHAASDLWFRTGSPYMSLPAGWSPTAIGPYLYSPASWPFLLVAQLPGIVSVLAVVPILLSPPSWRLAPIAACLLAFGLSGALWLGNASLLVGALLVIALGRRGLVSGVAFAFAVALRPQPLLLLPFIAVDRPALRWFVATIVPLAVSGTLLLGLGSWEAWIRLVTTEANIGANISPWGWPGSIVALGIALTGIRLRSVSIAMLGVTFVGGHVTLHYLVPLAAVMPFERIRVPAGLSWLRSHSLRSGPVRGPNKVEVR